MEFEALDMFKKSALCIHANNFIWPMQGGILPFNGTEVTRWEAMTGGR